MSDFCFKKKKKKSKAFTENELLTIGIISLIMKNRLLFIKMRSIIWMPMLINQMNIGMKTDLRI
jgi:hypothetical protein